MLVQKTANSTVTHKLDFRVLRFRKFTMSSRRPTQENIFKSAVTASSLFSTLAKGQKFVEKTSLPHHKIIIKEADPVYFHLKEIRSYLTNAHIQQLRSRMLSKNGDSESKINLWLRLVLLLTSSNASLHPVSSNNDDMTRRHLYNQYTRLSHRVLEVLNVFEEDFHSLTSKLKSLHKSYRKYAEPLISNSEEYILPPMPDFLADEIIVTKISEDFTTKPSSKESIFNDPVSPSTTPKVCICILSLTNRDIILESLEDSKKFYHLSTALPVKEDADSNYNLSFLDAFITHILMLISNSKDALHTTSAYLVKLTPNLEKCTSKLVSVLDSQRKKGRLRRSICSLEVRQALCRIELEFEKVSEILEDIPCNLKRILGMADYLSRNLQINDVQDVVFRLYLKNTTFLGIPWYWPFSTNKRIQRFRQEALFDGEGLLNDLILNKQKWKQCVQLRLPCTPELANTIAQRVSVSDYPENKLESQSYEANDETLELEGDKHPETDDDVKSNVCSLRNGQQR